MSGWGMVRCVQRKVSLKYEKYEVFTTKKIAERIDISRRTVENNIKKMKESDIVVRHGSPKNGCWEIVE